jgi:hypothetical protein
LREANFIELSKAEVRLSAGPRARISQEVALLRVATP